MLVLYGVMLALTYQRLVSIAGGDVDPGSSIR